MLPIKTHGRRQQVDWGYAERSPGRGLSLAKDNGLPEDVEASMNLTFSWKTHEGTASPQCESDTTAVQGVSPLSCLLSDDGGQRYQSTLPWLDVGLRSVVQSRQNPKETLNWSRDAWAADLHADTVRIYSLFDDAFSELMSLDSFERALVAWRDFLADGPEFASSVVVDIGP